MYKDTKPWKCTHEGCTQKFIAKHGLMVIYVYISAYIYMYLCTHVLQDHLRVHTGENLEFPCPVENCTFQSTTRMGLQVHTGTCLYIYII